MKQKILKGLKLILVCVCIVLMFKCFVNSDFRTVYNNFDYKLWECVWNKNKDKQSVNLIINPHINSKVLNITYNGNVINCKNLWEYKKEKSHKWALESDYDAWEESQYISYWDTFGKVHYWQETYFIDMFNINTMRIETDAEFEAKIYAVNYFQKPSASVLEIILHNDLKNIDYEVVKDGIILISESDISESEVNLRMQNLYKSLEYKNIYSQDDKEIYSMYIQMISETECKVFLDLDNDGEFEYECVGKEREW